MKLFTRILILVAGLLVSWQASATTFTVLVGPNGSNSYSPASLPIFVGDQVRFEWVSGFHPTESESTPAAWATFAPSAASPVTTITFNTPGTYKYHCTVHATLVGSQWIGMTGQITVSGRPTATANGASAAPALNLFPNPNRGQATLQFAAKPGQDYKLRISNLIGREVRTLALKPELGADGLPVDLSNLPAGMYFYSLLVNDKVVSTKRLTLQQ